MRLGPILLQQHVGRMFRKHWKIQGKKVVYENGSLKAAKENGIEFLDANDFIYKKPERKKLDTNYPMSEFIKTECPLNESHPDYKEEKCLTYGVHNVLLEGLKQAQVLTNSLILDPKTLPLTDEVLPDQELLNQDKLVRRCIRSSLLFDAWQEKLPKRHDPLREAWNFPRDYGITDRRRNRLLVQRLIQLCASYSPQFLGQRMVLNSANFKLPYQHHSGERLLFSVRGDAVILSDRSPSVGTANEVIETQLPDISPLAPTVSFEPTNIYKFEPHFPVSATSKLNKIHTVILHYNDTEVANLYETPVTVEQILGRSLVHSWVFAMSQALQNGGDGNKPVTIQLVQTDSKFFHFGVFKLCSQQMDSSTPNLFWSFPLMNLYDTCSYIDGKPILEAYNSRVFKTLLAFYNNV